jgi:hypothetical protein
MQSASGILAAGAMGESAPAANALTLEVAGLFVDPSAAAAVGAAYLRAQPAPGPTLLSLQYRVLGALRGDGSRSTRQSQIAARFRDCVRSDFESGHVVVVDGWMLSEVEAQACAVVYLNVTGAI